MISFLNKPDKEVIIGFLKGLYDSEGSICRYYVNFTTASKKGSSGTILLLKKLRIKPKVYYVQNKYFTITISGKENLRIFKDLINFTILRKSERFKDVYKKGW